MFWKILTRENELCFVFVNHLRIGEVYCFKTKHKITCVRVLESYSLGQSITNNLIPYNQWLWYQLFCHTPAACNMQPWRNRRGVLRTELIVIQPWKLKSHFIYQTRVLHCLKRKYRIQNIVILVLSSFLVSKAQVRPSIVINILWNNS